MKSRRNIVLFVIVTLLATLGLWIALGQAEEPKAAAPSSASAANADTAKPLSQRILHKETVVKATREEVWRLWTTSQGMSEWWVKGSEIELKVLGRYELIIAPTGPDGSRGNEGCRVLSYLPQEMLSFEWNFPPKVPALRDAKAKTHVVVHFDELGNGQVRIRLDQLGWQDGEDWQKGFDYFDKAWGFVLDLFSKHFAPADAAAKSP